MSVVNTAIEYLQSGLCVLPAIVKKKQPKLTSWKPYQTRLPTKEEVHTWFNDHTGLCLLTGAVSGNLEMIDFDHGAELFDPWYKLVASQCPQLLERLVIEQSQTGGRHVVYRCNSPVARNQKLAQRALPATSKEPVSIRGKEYVPREVKDGFEVVLTLIETRGEGGLFLCAPTPGYALEQGSFQAIPLISESERSLMLEAACTLEESPPPVDRTPGRSTTNGRPGDDFNERGNVPELLLRHGWKLVRGGENECWARPGKEIGWSATLKERVFYVFSSNAHPFEPDHAYSPFSVYALLEHAGNYPAAASALRVRGFGQTERYEAFDPSWSVDSDPSSQCEPAPEHRDPGPMPVEMFRVPGFISEVMDHCLETAPYPNVPLAFCGALALQAMLAGRKVCDLGDNRTNLYVLALAHSSVGKDWPRKINTHILHHVGLVEALGEKFASGEGIQDSLFRTPSMLFQTDEIDGLLQSINKAQDARHEMLMGTLLTLYSSANSIFPMRRKAGKDWAGVIDQPSLVLYGTAIPNHYYAALSERMLTNGLFARMLIVESGSRSAGQEPGIIRPSQRVLDTARWWSETCPGTGNLERFHPTPNIVLANECASALLTEARHASEAEYARVESRGDPVGMTVWGRVPEQIRKLALLFAISANPEHPQIDEAAVRWATDFVLHQTRRMLFMAQDHVSDNPFHALCLKLLRKLREAPNRTLPHSVLLKRMKIDAKTFHELIDTLEQQGDIQTTKTSRPGSPYCVYRLSVDVNGAGER